MGALNGREIALTTVVPFGDPSTLRLLSKSDWQGTGLAFLIPLPAEVRKSRAELSKAGIYICGGVAADNSPQIYVGQGILDRRIADHLRKDKWEWWTHMVAFIDGAGRLDAAHWLYIEDRLIARAKSASRYVCHNRQGGDADKPKVLSEAKRIEANHFLEQVLFCLPLLGVEWLSGEVEKSPSGDGLVLKAKGLTARGTRLPDGSFVVFQGSMADGEVQPTCPPYVKKLRSELVKRGVLKPENSGFRFSSDYTFSSPSQAACVVLGGSANGLAYWKDSDGRTLGDILAGTGKF